MFKKEHIDKLKHLEYYFTTATKYSYKRATTRQENELVRDVYKEAYGVSLTNNLSCPSCVLKMFRTVGFEYFKSVEALEKAAKAVLQVLEEADTDNSTKEVENKVIKKVKTNAKKGTSKKKNSGGKAKQKG